jgi:hypothetical protein
MEVRLVQLANPAESVNMHLRRTLHGVLAKSVDFAIRDILILDPSPPASSSCAIPRNILPRFFTLADL